MSLVIDYQEGDYVSEVDDVNLVAVVRKISTNKVVKRFNGESAWSQAQTFVYDLAFDPDNLIAQINKEGKDNLANSDDSG